MFDNAAWLWAPFLAMMTPITVRRACELLSITHRKAAMLLS